MKAETADYLAKARATLADAQHCRIAFAPCSRARSIPCGISRRRGLHFEQTGKVAKTHRGVRGEFARLARAEPRIGRDLITVFGTAYQFQARADYAVGSTATPITPAGASAAITTTTQEGCSGFLRARTTRVADR